MRNRYKDLEKRLERTNTELVQLQTDLELLRNRFDCLQSATRDLVSVLEEAGILRYYNDTFSVWISVKHMAKRVTALSNKVSMILGGK